MAWALERPDQAVGVVTVGGATMPWPGELGPWYNIASSDLGGVTIVPLLVNLIPRSVAERFAGGLPRSPMGGRGEPTDRCLAWAAYRYPSDRKLTSRDFPITK